MSGEERKRGDFGALQGCLVDGDAEQRARQRKIKRRALTLSVAGQSLLLAAVAIAPLFAKPALTLRPDFIPIPLYLHAAPERQISQIRHEHTHRPCWLCPPAHVPTVIVTRIDAATAPTGVTFDGNSHLNLRDALIAGSDARMQPPPPQETERRTPGIVHVTHLDPALLIWRVQPEYPPLAWQTRREGRVELHAIIATDGTVQSLEVISGDVLFRRSALEAVQHWRYRPTVLNGQPVQVDTTITVIYTLGQ